MAKNLYTISSIFWLLVQHGGSIYMMTLFILRHSHKIQSKKKKKDRITELELPHRCVFHWPDIMSQSPPWRVSSLPMGIFRSLWKRSVGGAKRGKVATWKKRSQRMNTGQSNTKAPAIQALSSLISYVHSCWRVWEHSTKFSAPIIDGNSAAPLKTAPLIGLCSIMKMNPGPWLCINIYV